MRPQKVNHVELIEGLMSVFRAKGYHGTRLNDLSRASGLQKGSLYHRFPGGKKDMGMAVLGFVAEWKEEHVISIVKNKKLCPTDRLCKVLKSINSLYHAGTCPCIMRALSMGDGMNLFYKELKMGTEKWLNAFTELGLDFGFTKGIAEEKAMQVWVTIQGGLIVSAMLDSTLPFSRAITEVSTLYIKR